VSPPDTPSRLRTVNIHSPGANGGSRAPSFPARGEALRPTEIAPPDVQRQMGNDLAVTMESFRRPGAWVRPLDRAPPGADEACASQAARESSQSRKQVRRMLDMGSAAGDGPVGACHRSFRLGPAVILGLGMVDSFEIIYMHRLRGFPKATEGLVLAG